MTDAVKSVFAGIASAAMPWIMLIASIVALVLILPAIFKDFKFPEFPSFFGDSEAWKAEIAAERAKAEEYARTYAGMHAELLRMLGLSEAATQAEIEAAAIAYDEAHAAALADARARVAAADALRIEMAAGAEAIRLWDLANEQARIDAEAAGVYDPNSAQSAAIRARIIAAGGITYADKMWARTHDPALHVWMGVNYPTVIG